MLAQLYMTGKQYPNPTRYTQHEIKCTVNDVVASFTVADDELCTLGVYRDDELLGYIGRNGLVKNHGEAELLNGRFSPKLSNAPRNTTIRKVESRYIGKDRIHRERVLH